MKVDDKISFVLLPVEYIYIYRADSLESAFVSDCVNAFDVIPLKLLLLELEVNAPAASRKIHTYVYNQQFIVISNYYQIYKTHINFAICSIYP